jgi:predicted RNase H-like HicB family nuclease
MLFIYPAIFHHEDNAYWVEFPDLEGCQTFADTLQEALASAQESLTGYLLTLLEEGAEIASPSDISEITPEENSFTTLVSCDLSKYNYTKSVKKTLTIPSWLNERAIAKGINFSQVLQDALISRIQA